jgi:hypothetical protein
LLTASPRSNWQVLCHVRCCYCLRSIWQVCSPIWYAGFRYATTTAVFCVAASDLELAFPRSIRQCRNFRLKKLSTSSPSALPFSFPPSSRPRYNNCLHLSRRTSPFRKLQQKTSSRTLQTASALFSLPTKTLRKREKTMRTSAVFLNKHHLLTNSRFAPNTFVLPMSIRPRRTNPSAPLSVYLTSCCAERKERDKDEA